MYFAFSPEVPTYIGILFFIAIPLFGWLFIWSIYLFVKWLYFEKFAGKNKYMPKILTLLFLAVVFGIWVIGNIFN